MGVVIERDDLVANSLREGGHTMGFTPPVGDPSLELFGHGWTPAKASSAEVGSYRGRHRAEN
ncbi:hypothetical protein [Mycobacterium sp. NPDC006124]|uniref:hypothetical protein n=1 Tax=Mycobacterium sp. NPDC006124 TaxID=3156729 RepID=UPI0033B82401